MSQFAPAADTPVRLRAIPPTRLRAMPADPGFAIPTRPHPLRRAQARRETWWQEALRWSTIALSASLAAGELLLWIG